MSCLLPKQNVGFKDSSTPRGDYLILLFICVLWDLHLCVFLGFQRRKSTIRCHQALLLLCSPPASCVHLMSMTPSLVWRMWPRLQCESHNSSSGSFILFIFLAYWKILASKYLLDTLCVFLEMDIVFMGVYSSLTLLSAGVWRSWSLSSSDATLRRCRISRSWNTQRPWLSISWNWGGKTRWGKTTRPKDHEITPGSRILCP